MMYKAIKLTDANARSLITEYCHSQTTVEDYMLQYQMNAADGFTTYLSINDFDGWKEGDQYNVYLHDDVYGDPFSNAPYMTDTEFKEVIL